MLKVVIVGCGQIADAHVQEIRKIRGATVIAVCDREKMMAEQLSERYRIPKWFDDFGEMLQETAPDVVHVTTPPQSHYMLAKTAMEAGCHVYIEKPFTVSSEEAKGLLELARQAGRKVTVGHNYFFDPPALALRKLVSEGTIGEPVHLESHYGYNLAGPYGSIIFADKNHWIHGLPGKLFHNNIDHLLYKVTEYLPDESPDVHALGFRRNPESFGDIRDQVFDELRVLIKGEQVTAYATLTAHAKPVKHSLRIYGTKGTLFADFVSRVVIEEEGQSLPSAIGRILPAFNNGFQFVREGGRNVIRFIRSDFHFFSGLNRLISLFYESIATGGDVPISYENIMRTVSMSEEIFKKIRGREHA